MRRGEIYLANLNPGGGTEPGKTRPVLIVQDQALIDAQHPSTLIIPLTTRLIDNAEPLRLRIPAGGKLNKTSDLIIDQLRAIDNRRLIEDPLLKCTDTFMLRVEQCMQEILGILETVRIPVKSTPDYDRSRHPIPVEVDTPMAACS